MTQWYYAHGGQQMGPVGFEELQGFAKSGALQPRDLVWNSSMKDWLPASSVPGIFSGNVASSTAATSPYAAPTSSWTDQAPLEPGAALPEIPYGSDPFDATACIKRGFTLTVRRVPVLILVTIVYLAIYLGCVFGFMLLDHAMGWGSVQEVRAPAEAGELAGKVLYSQRQASIPNVIFCSIINLFLMIGLFRILLNIASGKEATVAMLFSGGRLVPRMILALILFHIVTLLGFILFIVPGVYLWLRYGYFMIAMVDRNLGVWQSFKYSSDLTTNNRLNILILWLLIFGVTIAGFLALCVGIFFATPVVSLAYVIAYRWMQYGQRSVLDHPGTQTPMLSSAE